MKKLYPLSILFYLLLSFILVIPTFAQDTINDDEVNEVAKGLYCPVCESTPLDVCPTLACADWRELIRDKLGQGETQEEIYTYFALQYGDGVLAEPPREGASLILWLFPVIAVVVGGLYFGRTMRGLKVVEEEVATAVPAPAPPQNSAKPVRSLDDYIAQIEQELER